MVPERRHLSQVLFARCAYLSLLGQFALSLDGEVMTASTSAQRVLAFVALHDSPSLSRSYVAGSLWPDAAEPRATGNLRTALWRLRQLRFPILEVDGCCVRLTPTVAVDHRDALALARRVLDPLTGINEALLNEDLLTSDLLVGWSDEWLLVEREQFRQLRLHALEALCERLTATGQYSRAIQAGLAAVAGEPLRESAQITLIRTHLAEGNRGEAIHQYLSYRRLLREELGLEPSPQMKDLVRSYASTTR